MRIARWPVLAAIAVATGAGAAQAPAPPAAAAPERARANPLLWNARERTAAGLARLDAGDPSGAADALDSAWQLEPDQPLAAFNAGTGRLLAGRPDALPALEAAARAVADAGERGEDPAGLAPDAFFNLGNARLAAGDAAGAVEAYAETLRRAPRREDAKRNLELALRALEQQQQQSQGDSTRDQDTRNQSPGGQASESGSGEGDPKQDEETAREGENQDPAGGESNEGGEPQAGDARGDAANGTGDPTPTTSAPPSPSSTEGHSPSSSPSTEETSSSPNDPESPRGAASAGSRRRERLPGFVDQEEMTAEQAAALLDAVEDLERQQRRQRALERARRRAEVEKDW